MVFARSRRYREPLYLRRLPSRPRSRTAFWALRFAAFAPLLALVSVFALRTGIADTSVFLVLVACVLAVALAGLILIAAALQSLWSRGTRGGRAVIWAIFFSVLTFAPFAAGSFLWTARPRQVEVSTDLVDPPLFASEARSVSNASPALAAATLKNGYPGLTGRRYRAAPDAIHQTVTQVAESFGWTLRSSVGRVGADDELVLEFASRVPVIGLPGRTILRVTDEGETSYLDIRSRTPGVPHDLGWNALLVERFLSRLDFELVGIVEADPA